ncbi:MAG: T9SS type A sorting domain-containing protein [Bacteroidota bacterium]
MVPTKKIINKISILVIAIFLLGIKVQAQTTVTVSNGNWSNPAIWSPPGVPSISDTVIIDHNVILDQDISFLSGSLTVNASIMEDLTSREISLLTSNFTNEGIVVVSFFKFMDGMIINKDSLYIKRNFSAMNAPIDNSGIIHVVDTLEINNGGDLTNSGVVTTDNFIDNEGSITNNALITTKDILNGNIFVNNDTVIVTGTWVERELLTNYGYIHITDTLHIDGISVVDNHIVVTTDNFVWIEGTLNNMGFFTAPTIIIDVNDELYNKPNGIVVTTDNFINHGDIEVYNNSIIQAKNIFSTGKISGAYGCIFVSDSSNVSGDISGPIDFCDATALASNPIDIFTGTVSAQVTFCIQNCGAVGINNQSKPTISVVVYPNPVTDAATLSLSVQESGIYQVEMHDVVGRKVYDHAVEINSKNYQFAVPCNHLRQGTYLLTIKNEAAFYKTLLLKME